jgi:NifU-like protein involved in Fe-S cluster formation
MNENVKKLFAAIAKDKELAKKFEGCETVEASYQVAISIVDGYTIEEYKDAVQMMAEKAKASGELSDEELEMISGGSGFTDFLKGFVYGLTLGQVDILNR